MDDKKYIKALKESKHVKTTIEHALSGIHVNDILKEKIVAGYMSVAMYHHSSIILLIENELHSSAAALARSLLEACYRGTWIALIADDDIAEEINSYTFEFKPTWKVAQEIDSFIGSDIFYSIFRDNKDFLNGMTHGGIELISRQFDIDGSSVASTFTNEELISLLKYSNAHLALTLLGFGYNSDNKELIGIAHKLIHM